MTDRMTEEAELGYLHFFYEVEKYFSETIVGKDVDTKGWTFKEYAEQFVEYEIENCEVYIDRTDTEPFAEGMRCAHKDFLKAIYQYRLKQSAAPDNTLRVVW